MEVTEAMPEDEGEGGGTPDRIRTCDLLLRRPKISITYERRLLKPKGLGLHALDPDGPKFGGFRRFGPCPDPPQWLAFHVLFAHARGRLAFRISVQNMLLRQNSQIAI